MVLSIYHQVWLSVLVLVNQREGRAIKNAHQLKPERTAISCGSPQLKSSLLATDDLAEMDTSIVVPNVSTFEVG